MTLLLAVILALIPLAIAPGWFFYFDVTPKTVLLLLGTGIASIWWAASGAGFYRGSRAAKWFVWVLAGMAVSLLVSTTVSVNRPLSIGGSTWRCWGLIAQLAALAFTYLVAACCAGRSGHLRVILRGVTTSGMIVALYGISQYLGWDPLLDARGYHVGEGILAIVRPPATLGHADYSAGWLLFVVFAAVALIASEHLTFWKWLAGASVAAGSVAIILSGSRAAMLGLLLGALILIAQRGRRFRLSHVAWGLTIAAAAVGFYVSPAGERLRARVYWSRDEPAGGARLLLWRDSLRMALPRWPAGYGPDTFTAAFARHQSRELARAYPDFYQESPHNIFLDVLEAQGAPGLLLLLSLAASGFVAGRKARGNRAAAALVAGLAAMTVSEQFTSFTLPTALAYYVTIAMLVSLGAGEPSPRKADHRRLAMAVAAPCAALLVFLGVRLWLAESSLAAVRRDLDAGLVRDAAKHYAAYQKWRWPGPSADLWYSRRLVQFAVSDAAQLADTAAQRATQTTEAEFNAYYNLAAFYARRNDYLRTEQSLRAAIYYAPNWFKPHWMLAQVLEAGSRLKEAEREAATAAALDGGKHPEVIRALDRIRSAESQHK